MAKKPSDGKRGGWPADTRTAEQRKARIVERIIGDLRSRTISQEKYRATVAGLLTVVSGWREMFVALPRPRELAAALRPLSEAERKSLHSKASRSPRRRRARLKAYGRFFDETVRDRLRAGFETALERAASQEEAEAIGVGLCLLAEDGPTDLVDNPLLAFVTDMISREAEGLEVALAEFRRLRQPADEQGAARDEEPRECLSEFLGDKPAAAIAFSRFIAYSMDDLLNGIASGRIKACLTEDELGPLLDDLDRPDQEEPSEAAAAEGDEAEAPAEGDEPDAPAQSDESAAAAAPGDDADAPAQGDEPDDADGDNIYTRFAAVTGNRPAFDRFIREFAAEAEAARAVEEPTPDDELVAAVADYLESGVGSSDISRAVIAQASVLRVLHQRIRKAVEEAELLEAQLSAQEQTATEEDSEEAPS